MKTKIINESVVDAINNCASVESFETLLKLVTSTTILNGHINIYKAIDAKIEDFAQLGVEVNEEILKEVGGKISEEVKLITQRGSSLSESLQKVGFIILSEGMTL